jgi:hypothetical protein
MKAEKYRDDAFIAAIDVPVTLPPPIWFFLQLSESGLSGSI